MNYAIETLEKENDLIKKCLNKSDYKNHPEAKRRQLKKSKELEIAIEQINKNKTK